jgi:predicted small secreted protein
MDFVITCTRFLVGVPIIIAIAILLIVIVWPFEWIVGPLALIVCAVFMNREDIKNSWLGNWPLNVPNEIAEISRRIWDWIFDDWAEDD